MKLVFASNNAHKLSEVKAIMPAGIDVLSLREIGFLQEIEETGTTLSENSRIKAETVWEWVKKEKTEKVDGVFADDTGIEIDALDGRPGVYTARWSGATGTEQEIYTANRAKALHELKGNPNRGAQFRTVVTLITADGRDLQVDGIVRGRLTEEEHGTGGFGYDPIFVPEGYDKTFGELPTEVKNTISHRARAMANLVEKLKMYDY